MGDLAAFGGPDPKPKRTRGGVGRPNRLRPTHGDPAVVGAVRLAKCQDCRLCHTSDSIHAHHLIPRSKGGLWHIDNIVGLCRGCHALIHGRDPAALYLLRNTLTPSEKGYCVGVMGEGWLDRRYPVGPAG